MFVVPQERPWPFDMEVDDTPIQLVPDDAGELLATKANTLDNVVPNTYDLSSYPLHAERTLNMRRFRLGMGLPRQEAGHPKRYSHGLFVDTSIDGMVGKGPHFHQQDGVAGQEGRTSVLGLDGGTLKEFGAFGRYVYKRNTDLAAGWVLSKDFGAGRTVTDLARFKNRGGTVVDAVYAALDNGELWQYTGAAWGACTLPAGFLPNYLEVGDEDLFAIGGNDLRSATADPTVAGNWSGPVFVGDASAAATGLAALAGTIVAFKEDGPYSVSGLAGTLEVAALMPELRHQRAATNGRTAKAFRDALWFRHGDTLWKMHYEGGEAVFTTVGLSVLMDHDAEVRGTPVAFAGHQNWFGYFAVVSGTNSYLCKWGTWLNPDESDETRYQFLEVPHGALYKWSGKVVSNMWVSNVAGPTANERLYVQFVDGTVEYCLLPKGTPNPYASGSGCEFTVTNGQIYFAEVHCDFQTENKSWRGVTILAPEIDASNTARHFYRTSGSAAYVEMESQFNINAQRAFFPDNLGSKTLQQYAQLENGSTATSPLVEGWYLHYSVVPITILEYAGAADARHYRARHDGVTDVRSPDVIRQAMLAAVGAIGATPCVMPDGSSRTLNFYDYGEVLPSKWRRFGREWLVPFKAVEFRTSTVYGTYARMEQYTYGELEIEYGQIETL